MLKPNMGTAEALLKIKDKIKTDFIVTTCDLIISEHFLYGMADLHRTRDASVTLLLKKPQPKTTEELQRLKASKNEAELPPADFIGITDQFKCVHFTSSADLDESLTVTKSLLRTYPNFTLYTNLLDCHFYIFSKWTLDVLSKYEKQVSSLKGEFIPFLVKLQLRKKLKKGGVPDFQDTQSLAISMSSSARTAERDPLGCFAYIMEEGTAFRVNTIQSYLDANHEVTKGTSGYLPIEKPGRNNYIHESAIVDGKTQVGPECIVGDGTKVGERVAIKKSIIGKHCTIGNNAKIVNSIVMDHVTIGDNCNIQNSIICNNAHIGNNSQVNNCQLGVAFNLDPNSKSKNESLVADDMGVSSDQEESDSELL